MKNGFKKYIIYAILIVGVLILVFKNNDPVILVKTSALRLEDASNFKKELIVDLESNIKKNGFDICYFDSEYCKYSSLAIKTESDDAYLLGNYKREYFMYSDNNKVKVYNYDENKSYIVDGIDPSYNIDFIINDNDKLIGVVYSTDLNSPSTYLKIDGNKIMYDKKYDYIVSLNDKYLSSSKYDEDGNQIGAYILSNDEEKNPLLTKELDTDLLYSFYKLGNKYITFEHGDNIEIYNNNLKLIYESNKANVLNVDGTPRLVINADYNDNIYVYEDGYLNMLDSNGKVLKKSINTIKGIDLVDSYIINTDNKELTITDIDNNKIVITSLNNGNLDYYDFYNNNKKRGIFFIVYDNTLKYEDVYNSCKNTSCNNITLDEIKESYKLGYQLFYDYDTKKVSKEKTIIYSYD